MKKIRTNILIPVDLAEEIKKAVGPRKRSSFLVEAAWEKLERMKLANALKGAAGAWSPELHPDLQTQDDINRWLRSLRREDAGRLKGFDTDFDTASPTQSKSPTQPKGSDIEDISTG
jgi:hypothetical protein